MKKSNEKVIEARMLGRFDLSYDGREVVLGKNSRAKFIQLLQLVWLQGEKGVTKDQILQSLYEREVLSNSGNSFNNLVYQLRRQAVHAGLPEGDYIVKKNGRYVPDENIPVRVDVLEFGALEKAAAEEQDEEKKFQYHKKAFDLYRGELLPNISTEIWVTAENAFYKAMYEECVTWLGEYLKKRKDYSNMFLIYTRAAEIYPFDDWQTHQIESLLCMSRYKEAYELYDRAVRLYSEEMGLPPTDKMMACYEQMSRSISYSPGDLMDISAELREEKGSGKTSGGKGKRESGAYFCSYPGFVDLYRIMCRNVKRNNVPVHLMLCTLVDYEGKMIQNDEKLKTRSAALKKAIQSSLRKGDAFTKYSSAQYLVLLIGTREQDCETIYRRIKKNLKRLSGPRAELQYTISSLTDLPDNPEIPL
ncbi:MAG: BTAD domain-containing putative transcriptional regulator [Enterocloster sp.]